MHYSTYACILYTHVLMYLHNVQANFAGGRRELNVSTYQMIILMQFNDPLRPSLTLDQIRQGMIGVPEIEFRRHLLSLCTPKLRILKKSSTGKVPILVLELVLELVFVLLS